MAERTWGEVRAYAHAHEPLSLEQLATWQEALSGEQMQQVSEYVRQVRGLPGSWTSAQLNLLAIFESLISRSIWGNQRALLYIHPSEYAYIHTLMMGDQSTLDQELTDILSVRMLHGTTTPAMIEMPLARQGHLVRLSENARKDRQILTRLLDGELEHLDAALLPGHAGSILVPLERLRHLPDMPLVHDLRILWRVMCEGEDLFSTLCRTLHLPAAWDRNATLYEEGWAFDERREEEDEQELGGRVPDVAQRWLDSIQSTTLRQHLRNFVSTREGSRSFTRTELIYHASFELNAWWINHKKDTLEGLSRMHGALTPLMAWDIQRGDLSDEVWLLLLDG